METSAAAPAATQNPPPSTVYAMTVASTAELEHLRSAKISTVRLKYTLVTGLPADGLTKAQLLQAIAMDLQKQIREAVA